VSATEPGFVSGVLAVAQLTFVEARRKRVVGAALLFGAAFVLFFGIGLYFIVVDARTHMTATQTGFVAAFIVTAALYAANFLIVMTSVLVAVDSLAGEIASGMIEAICTKPLSRAAVGLGKWLGCWALLWVYAAVLCGGVLLVGRLVGGYMPRNVGQGMALLLLEGTLLMTLAFAGGTRLSALANGITVFGLFGLAFIGGWMEQIGARADNDTDRYVGIAASLLVPSESLWQLAAHLMQPPIVRDINLTPFSAVSVPSPAMVVWALAYGVVALGIGIRLLQTRDL